MFIKEGEYVIKSYSEILYENLISRLNDNKIDIFELVYEFDVLDAIECNNDPYDLVKWRELVGTVYAKALLEQLESGKVTYSNLYKAVIIPGSILSEYLPPFDLSKCD